MSLKRVPTLSTTGIMEDDDSIVNRLFLYFTTSEYSQTFFYEKHVASLKYLIYKYGKDEIEFKKNVKSALINMYNRYYSNTEAEVTITEDLVNKGILHLKIDIITFNESKELLLSNTLSIENSKLGYFNEHLEDLYKR